MHAYDEAVKNNADIIVLPELAVTSYPPEDLLLRDDFMLAAEQTLATICQHVSETYLIIGHPARQHSQLFNAASVIHDGKIIATYHKQCLPNYGVFDEKRYFSADTDTCIVEMKNKKFALTICEDLWQPEPALQAKKLGAEAIISLNASPFDYGKASQRQELLRQRVIETGLPIFYVNLVGGQDELVFDGGSMVLNNQAEVVAKAEYFSEASLNITWNNEFTPQSLTTDPTIESLLYQALVTGTRDYIEKNGFNGALLGLSGGIDSALVLAIAADAIGADRVHAIMMPSQYTADMSLQDAEQEVKALGVKYSIIEIKPLYDSFMTALADEFQGKAADTTEENLQARCRGVINMAVSNKTGNIVLTTGNKSEMAVGYATLYGDMAGGFSVIKDVPKTLVYQLARYRNSISPVIPERVITRPPSAELAPDQKDEDSLPPYEVLDPILQRFIEQDESMDDIVAAGFERDTVDRIIRLVKINEYKRRQAAPGIKITPRAFGRERRYPITSKF